jgi:hypothetical protein
MRQNGRAAPTPPPEETATTSQIQGVFDFGSQVPGVFEPPVTELAGVLALAEVIQGMTLDPGGDVDFPGDEAGDWSG